MTIEEIIARYRKAAIQFGEASDQANPQSANKASDELAQLEALVREGGPELQEAFLILLNDDSIWVREWAAVDALAFAPERAVPVLQEIEQSGIGFASVDAKWVLRAWREGTFRRGR